MPDVSIVCVREDARLGDQLAAALERYGFSVCRSATVYESFQGYAGVIVLLSPASTRSELVVSTAERALDCLKLIPAFVGFCAVPDRLAGIAMHDLSAWGGAAEDSVIAAIAQHAARIARVPGRPSLGPSPARQAIAPPPRSMPLQPPEAYARQIDVAPTYEQRVSPPPYAEPPAPYAPPPSQTRTRRGVALPNPVDAGERRRIDRWGPAFESPAHEPPAHAPRRAPREPDSSLTPIDEGANDRRSNPFAEMHAEPVKEDRSAAARRRRALSGHN